jgi:RimJ/RimL family protein N-acetyltransferase
MPDAYLEALSVDDRVAQWRGSLEREEQDGKRTFVVEAEHRPLIGCATVGEDEQPGRGLLLLMYVLEEAWGTGVGRALLGAAENRLRDLGYSTAVLWVLERNQRARRFYEAAGWRADGERQMHDYGDAKLEAIRYAITL